MCARAQSTSEHQGSAAREVNELLRTVKAKFAEFTIHELRRCRSELHTTRDRKRKLRIFEPPQGIDTRLTRSLKNPRFLCRPSATLSRAPERHFECSCSRGADSRRPKGPNPGDDGSNRLLYTSRSGRPDLFCQTRGP